MANVYISHPLRGAKPYTKEQCRKNIDMVTQICIAVSRDFDRVTPISPIHAFSFMDALECNHEKAMDYCHSLLANCDVLWVFGDWTTSSGCISEIESFACGGQGGIVFCDFCTETGKITKTAAFSLSHETLGLIGYLFNALKKGQEHAGGKGHDKG